MAKEQTALSVLTSMDSAPGMWEMVRKMTAKQLFLALRDRQTSEEECQQIIDGIVGLAVLAVTQKIGKGE